MLLATGIGAVVGLLATRRPRHSADRGVGCWPLLLGGLAVQVAASRMDNDVGAYRLLVASYALLVAFALVNLSTAGMWLVGLGVALNLVVIVANGGMPVRSAALEDAGLAPPGPVVTLEFTGKRHFEGADDRLRALADIVPVRPLREVVSFGDLIMATGVAAVLARLLRRPGRAPVARYWRPPPAPLPVDH
ncbi:MAG: DUF5317 family protein [Acidimicrobiales bacterium]